jgi:hypothetical protein
VKAKFKSQQSKVKSEESLAGGKAALFEKRWAKPNRTFAICLLAFDF